MRFKIKNRVIGKLEQGIRCMAELDIAVYYQRSLQRGIVGSSATFMHGTFYQLLWWRCKHRAFKQSQKPLNNKSDNRREGLNDIVVAPLSLIIVISIAY